MDDNELYEWMHDLFEMDTKAEVLAALKAHDTETRREALQEAAEVARTTKLTLNDIDYEGEVIADEITSLIEEDN